MKHSAPSGSSPAPSPQTKAATSTASSELTASEIESLRRWAKDGAARLRELREARERQGPAQTPPKTRQG